jgi:ATP-dependent DNA helicase RecQ
MQSVRPKRAVLPPGRRIIPPVTATLLDIMSKHWGYGEFRPLQQEAMEAVLAKRDSLVVMPTGAGKSLCYQAPALAVDGVTIVVSPLISLMKDQVDGLVECGVAAAQLNSSLEAIDQRIIEKDLVEGRTKLLFVSPERLAVRSFRQLLGKVRVAAFSIDEAHCISHWGHDFRPEYRQLRTLRNDFPDSSIHAYTATAAEQVRRDIAQQLGLRDPLILVGSFDRPNLTYRILGRSREVAAQIEDVIRRHPKEGGIVYCIRRRDVDEITTVLERRGHSVVSYHAGLDAEARRKAQERFTNEDCDIVVATVAFGMGIDRSNVRWVLHAGMPKSLEHYQQETGRAGRDGLDAECVLLYSPSDPMTWKTIMENASTRSPDDDKPSDSLSIALAQLNTMRDFCTRGVCRHRAIAEYFGQQYPGERCNACDVCLDELESVDDATVVAQKILSCVVRLRYAYGANYLASVLRGENLQKIVERGHSNLSTFGILKEWTKDELRDAISQLLANDVLRQEGDTYPVLVPGDRARAVLRGDEQVRLTRSPAAKREKEARPARREVSWTGVDRELFETLRAWRIETSREREVPPFVIFSDATLRAIAARLPDSRAALRGLHGVGDAKLAEFGDAVLEIVRAHSSREERTDPA